ncbi:hypothetical protein C8R45DRAFT_1019022 [Mycena sanguinolenta]|nr:hypothetical protein C8R45DRAFT_1019022 [Mycena sanguinolenta]
MKGGGSWQEALANKGRNPADKDRMGRLARGESDTSVLNEKLRNKRYGHDQLETRGDGKQRRRKANRKPQTYTIDVSFVIRLHRCLHRPCWRTKFSRLHSLSAVGLASLRSARNMADEKLVENDFAAQTSVQKSKHWPSSSCRFQPLVVGRRIMDLGCQSAGGRTIIRHGQNGRGAGQEKRRAADKKTRANFSARIAMHERPATGQNADVTRPKALEAHGCS